MLLGNHDRMPKTEEKVHLLSWIATDGEAGVLSFCHRHSAVSYADTLYFLDKKEAATLRETGKLATDDVVLEVITVAHYMK